MSSELKRLSRFLKCSVFLVEHSADESPSFFTFTSLRGKYTSTCKGPFWRTHAKLVCANSWVTALIHVESGTQSTTEKMVFCEGTKVLCTGPLHKNKYLGLQNRQPFLSRTVAPPDTATRPQKCLHALVLCGILIQISVVSKGNSTANSTIQKCLYLAMPLVKCFPPR